MSTSTIHDEEESIGITSIAENDNKGKDSSEDYQIADEPSFTYKQQHTATILSLTGPIVLSEIFQNILPIVDIAFVGNLGKDELGAAALATVWFNLWNTAMLGLMTATDTMLSQSWLWS
jgi:Na+-driven multidrug efflux pump